VTGRSCRRRWTRQHPFDCSSLRSEQVTLTSFGSRPSFDGLIRPTLSCGSGCERTLCPSGAKRASITCVQRRSAHRIRGTTLVVGTGGAVRPLYPLLVRARPSVHRSDDRTGLRRSKDFRLSQGKVYRPLPASVVIPWTPQREVQPVSQSTGISAVPHSQGLRGARSAIY
jgi:hypothetical protein